MTSPAYIPDHAYFDHVESFEQAFPYLSHAKADPQWGRVAYLHPNVDCLFCGWALGRATLALSIRNSLP